MKKVVYCLILISLLTGCDLLEDELTEQELSEKCNDKLAIPEIRIPEYSEHSITNDQLYKKNAINARQIFLIKYDPDIWRYNYSFYPKTPLVDGFIYPMEGTPESEPIGIEIIDTIYKFVNPEPGNNWLMVDLPTSTTGADYVFEAWCECEDGTVSEVKEVNFTSVEADEIFGGLIFRGEIQNNKLVPKIETFNNSGFTILNNLGELVEIYTVTKKLRSLDNVILYEYRFDFITEDLNALNHKSFSEITGLPAEEQTDVSVFIITETYAYLKKSGTAFPHSPYTLYWPHMEQ